MSPVRQNSCKGVVERRRRYRVRIKSPPLHRTVPQSRCAACPLDQVDGFLSAAWADNGTHRRADFGPARTALAAQEERGRYRRGDGSEFGCPQSSEVDLTGSTSIVTSQTSHPMFMLTEIRRHAKSGFFPLHWHRALALAPGSSERLNDWSA